MLSSDDTIDMEHKYVLLMDRELLFIINIKGTSLVSVDAAKG